MRDKKALFSILILCVHIYYVYGGSMCSAFCIYDELFLFIIEHKLRTKMAADAVVLNAVAFWGERKSFHYFRN